MKSRVTTIKKNVTKMSSNLMAFILLITFEIFVFSTAASAHELKETSARITLRDGQVEIKLATDLNHWQIFFQDNKAWLMGDINQVMPSNLNPQQNKVFLIDVLKKNTILTINGMQVALDVVSISTINEQHYAEIVLSGKHTNSKVNLLNIRFPKSLGAVHASFVKPQYKMITPGSSAQISFDPS